MRYGGAGPEEEDSRRGGSEDGQGEREGRTDMAKEGRQQDTLALVRKTNFPPLSLFRQDKLGQLE